GATAACRASNARCDPWVRPSAASSARAVSQGLQHREGRVARGLRTAARARVAVRAAARTEPRALLPAQRLHRKREADQLVDEAREIDLAAAVPARVEPLRQTHTVARKRLGPLGVGRLSLPRRLEHQAERLPKRVTIAREAARAFERD